MRHAAWIHYLIQVLPGTLHCPTTINFWLAHHAPILFKTLISIPLLTQIKLHPSVILINLEVINGSLGREALNNFQV